MNSDEEKHNSKYEDKNGYNMDWNFAQICVLYRYDKRERSVSLGSQRSTQAGLYSAHASEQKLGSVFVAPASHCLFCGLQVASIHVHRKKGTFATALAYCCRNQDFRREFAVPDGIWFP